MFWKILKRALIGFVLLLLLVSGAIYFLVIRDAPIPVGNPGELRREKRAFAFHGIDRGEYERGTFFVPENRDDPNSRAIPIDFALFSSADPQGPPVFLLPGGPGNTFIDGADKLRLGKPPRFLAALLEQSHVILVNQRGYNHRHHKLEGWFMAPAPKVDATVEDHAEISKAMATSISESYADSEVDLGGYTILQCADDVDELRQALGYDKIVLMGQSFGSQWSLAVMRRHPATIERAILSGVEPLNHSYDMPSHVWAAAKRVWTTIDQDNRFSDYLPPGGMHEAAEAVISKLENDPINVTTSGIFGSRLARILGPDDFPWDKPVAILELYHGRTERWASARRGIIAKAPLIYQLIDSSTGITPERRGQIMSDPALRYVPQDNFAKLTASAAVWPSPDVGDEFRNPIACEIPVVFVHGDWDMNTPIENTREIAPYFPNSHTLEVRQGGHDPIPVMMKENPEVFKLIMNFAHTGVMNELPEEIDFKPSKRYDPPQFQVKKSD